MDWCGVFVSSFSKGIAFDFLIVCDVLICLCDLHWQKLFLVFSVLWCWNWKNWFFGHRFSWIWLSCQFCSSLSSLISPYTLVLLLIAVGVLLGWLSVFGFALCPSFWDNSHICSVHQLETSALTIPVFWNHWLFAPKFDCAELIGLVLDGMGASASFVGHSNGLAFDRHSAQICIRMLWCTGLIAHSRASMQ